MPLARAVLCAGRFPCFARRQKSDPGKSSGRDDCCSTREILISAVIKGKPRFPRVLNVKLVIQVFVIINSSVYTKMPPRLQELV